MANTQTAVPLFVANQVLTAAQQNISAGTGVPVFATTVTRDAAFGGSNKALAEGQLCYLESTNVVQYYDGAAWATVGPTTSGKLLQVVQATSTTATSTSSTSYVTTGLSASITPSLNTSKVLIMTTGMGFITPAAKLGSFTLFRGTVAGTNLAGATGITRIYSSSTDLMTSVATQFLDSPATTSATTYTLGMKVDSGTLEVQTSSTTAVIILAEVAA